MPELRERLIELMREREWDQYTLAQQADIAPATVHKILVGKTKAPVLSTVRALAAAFGVDVADLLDGQPAESAADDREESEAELDELVRGLDGVDVNLYAIKKLDPEEFELIARQLADRREKLERERREMRNAQRRRSKATKQAGQADTEEKPS